jgi:hypothetical protein
MFYLSDKDGSPVFAGDPSCMNHRIFEFDPKKLDYFLKQFLMWDRITSDVYTMKGETAEFYIPSGFYIYVGSWDGATDWVPIEELIDRDITVFVMSQNMDDWRLETLSVVGVTEQSFYYPVTKSPMPVSNIGGKRVFLMSSVDQYHKFKDQPPNIFFVDT